MHRPLIHKNSELCYSNGLPYPAGDDGIDCWGLREMCLVSERSKPGPKLPSNFNLSVLFQQLNNKYCVKCYLYGFKLKLFETQTWFYLSIPTCVGAKSQENCWSSIGVNDPHVYTLLSFRRLSYRTIRGTLMTTITNDPSKHYKNRGISVVMWQKSALSPSHKFPCIVSFPTVDTIYYPLGDPYQSHHLLSLHSRQTKR